MAITGSGIIETDRMILRNFCRSDLGEIAEVLGHPEVMRFSLSGPYSRQQCEKFVQKCIDDYAGRGFGLYAVILKASHKLIGYCGYFVQMIDSIEEVEIGYRLHPDHWNHGLATEAAQAVRDYGFERLGCSRLISIIDPLNLASIRVAEKIGMDYEKNSVFKNTTSVRIYAVRKGKLPMQAGTSASDRSDDQTL